MAKLPGQPGELIQFEELAAHRHAVQEFCRQHAASLLEFKSGACFKNLISDKPLERARHLTTTATCFESLLDCPSRYLSGVENVETIRNAAIQFATDALDRKDWESEGSAEIYCRCRALPLVARQLSDFDPRLEQHLKHVFDQLKVEPRRPAIGETALRDDKGQLPPPDRWYPPNAFHTYWLLDLLHFLKTDAKLGKRYVQIAEELDIDARIRLMVLWARHVLGLQISLHAAKSSVLDTDQLAWSLAIVLGFGEDFRFDLAEQDFIEEAVQCLFQTQLEVGTWRHYRSLFHYRNAGNAYCYVFETFTVLLKIALRQTVCAQFFRDCLRHRVSNLVRLWQYADRTKIPLSEPTHVGWCSAHRINQRESEGWATASVFSFAQNLRRLIGYWTRKEATTVLRVKPAGTTDPMKTIIARGDTWSTSSIGVADDLSTLFINPILKSAAIEDRDPDHQPIAESQARSAILFGPPGTSKTTLVSCVAASVGWEYIEVHASDFVARGLPEVQRTADEIFNRLMELDHTVVLFDEIDELVREREQEHDSFGRFLTTSMLPKLAQLWEQQKILYFVATNHIRYFDAAITRTHRFDAQIFVGPPSYEAKIKRLKEKLQSVGAVEFEDMRALVEQDLESFANVIQKTQPAWTAEIEAAEKAKWLEADRVLAKFALLIHDQLDELGHLLSKALERTGGRKVTVDMMRHALTKIADQRLRTCAPYFDFVRDREYRNRDYQKARTWCVEGLGGDEDPPGIKKAGGKYWLTAKDDSPPSVSGYKGEPRPGGIVRLRADSNEASAQGLTAMRDNSELAPVTE